MPIHLPDPVPLAAFVAASVVLAVTPGPGVLYIVMRSIAHGRGSGLASVAGVALGNLVNAWGAALGLAAIFAVSSVAYSAVKYLGALYLIWLGVRALRSAGRPAACADAPPAVPRRAVFRDGLVVAALNPKTALFFAAFLPQFVDPSSPPVAQSLVLGLLFVGIAACTDTLYAVAAGAFAPALRGEAAARGGRYLSGATFLGLGIVAALSDSRAARNGIP